MASEHPTENSQTTEGAAGVEQDLGAVLTGQNTPSFIARLGREAETALGSILDLAGRLRDASSDIDAVTTKIQGRGETLRRTFRSLRHLARLSDEDGAPDSEEVDAVALAQECLDELDSAARGTGLELALEAPSSPVEITTNGATLRQALRHLLANAIMSTAQGAVTLRVDEEDAGIAFRVESTGTGGGGEPDGDLSSLFEPFGQREPEQGASPKGLGLGLPLANAFSDYLGGALDVESGPEDRRGVTLRVPRDIVGATQEETDTGEDREAVRLLVVEDNDVTRRLLRRMLEDAYQVDMAEEAGEAIQQAEEEAYDVFILDVNLKDRRTGVEVLQAVRRMEGYGSTPAVACTAYALDDHREHFLRAGFDDVVAKPVTKREILDVVDRRLEEPTSSEVEAPEISLSGIELPPIPTTLVEVASLASSPESPDVEALTEALQKDAVVSQWLIRHINSAYYSMRESIDTVERAVRYLGFQPVCNLILTKVIGESFSGTEEPEGEQVQQYIMKTSVLAAYVARELSKEIGFEEPGVAYTGGIFAQIGRLALLEDEGETYVDLWFEEQDRSASFRGPPPQGQEILHFEEDYVQNGLAVGKACGVSEKLQAVLRGHHRPARAGAAFRPLVPVVAMAFKVAHHAGDLGDENPWDGEEALTRDLREFKVTRHVVEGQSLSERKLIASVVDIVEDAIEFVDEVLDAA